MVSKSSNLFVAVKARDFTINHTVSMDYLCSLREACDAETAILIDLGSLFFFQSAVRNSYV